MFKIGIDLGGTKIETIILDTAGREAYRDRVPTNQERGYEYIVERIAESYSKALTVINAQPHTFGIGTPGAVSGKTGLMKNSNTTCMNGKSLIRDLEKLINKPVAIENDANCFAMAEAAVGAGKGKNVVFGVIMGTGCGGGFIIHNKVLKGLQYLGGEWGHSTIDPNGPLCYCGKRGCVETYISGTGISNRYYDLTGKRLPAIHILESAQEAAIQVRSLFFEQFGRALSNVINIVDPDIIVLGGGLSNFLPLYEQGIDCVKKYIFSDELLTPIVKHKTGDSAGVLGAAWIGI
ncbi:MAG: ROK family protein [Cytophagales bacterium]|nr:ROK family protein [Cytophaga sp.]